MLIDTERSTLFAIQLYMDPLINTGKLKFNDPKQVLLRNAA